MNDAQLRVLVGINNDSDEPARAESSDSSDDDGVPVNIDQTLHEEEESEGTENSIHGPIDSDEDDNDNHAQSETSSVLTENAGTSEHGEHSTTSDLESLSEQVTPLHFESRLIETDSEFRDQQPLTIEIFKVFRAV